MWGNYNQNNCCCEKQQCMQDCCKQTCIKKEVKCCEKTCDCSKNMMPGQNSYWM